MLIHLTIVQRERVRAITEDANILRTLNLTLTYVLLKEREAHVQPISIQWVHCGITGLLYNI